MNVQKLAV